jgi:phospholipid/cholesterol/gamma-HCH transport system substrate-binding protein
MSAPTNRWKLGAFVVGSAVLGLAAAVMLSAQAFRKLTVGYTSYLDEAVTGLEVGSPVTYRGVKIGNVSGIEVAPDRRHVEITYSLGVAVLKRLGLSGETVGKETQITVPPDLRVQLASTGLTGTRYLQIDFFDVGDAPPPVLPFPVPENYIPATPSTMKNLEDAVVRAVDMLPGLAQEMGGTVRRVNLLLDDVGRHELPEKTAATLEGAHQLVASLRQKVDQVQAAELSHQAGATLQAATVTLAKLNRSLDRLDADDGVLASLQRTSDSLGDATGPRFARDLDETGRDLREAAVAVRQLVDALQRDPDMLIKGKSRVQR